MVGVSAIVFGVSAILQGEGGTPVFAKTVKTFSTTGQRFARPTSPEHVLYRDLLDEEYMSLE